MPAATAVAPLHPEDGNEDLSDAQIERLLARATTRLKSKPSAESQDVLKLDDDTPTYSFPKLQTGQLEGPYISQAKGRTTVDSKRLIDSKDRELANGARKVQNPVTVKQAALDKKKASAGKDWFDLPKTNLTPELKRDLQLIKMRGVLDPHRHYKKDGGKMKAPEFSQIGTIIEGPTEFFSGRIENKKRKRTFVEEVLSGEQETGRFKKKYAEMQTRTTSGKKAYYKALLAKRKTGGVRKAGKG